MSRRKWPPLRVGRLEIIRLRHRWPHAGAMAAGVSAAVAVAGATSFLQEVAAESSLQTTVRTRCFSGAARVSAVKNDWKRLRTRLQRRRQLSDGYGSRCLRRLGLMTAERTAQHRRKLPLQ